MAFAQLHAESVAWICPECLDTSSCHPATSVSECPQLHLGTPWGSRRRKRLEWKKVGIKRKWNWALKWKGRQDTVIGVSFHSTLNLQGWDQMLRSAVQQKALHLPIPAWSLPDSFQFYCKIIFKPDLVAGRSERETYSAWRWEQEPGAGQRAPCSSFAARTCLPDSTWVTRTRPGGNFWLLHGRREPMS